MTKISIWLRLFNTSICVKLPKSPHNLYHLKTDREPLSLKWQGLEVTEADSPNILLNGYIVRKVHEQSKIHTREKANMGRSPITKWWEEVSLMIMIEED